MNKYMIVKRGAGILGLLLMLGVTVAAYGFSRADCPGKVTCPLTGQEVCQDQCPLVDADRADCPGEIECPLSGESVCRDKCPVGAEGETAEAAQELPACCRDSK